MMSQKPYLIAVDLDGTLLTDAEKKITPRTKTALQKVMEQGHKVVIATGRPYRASRQYYSELQLNTPIVNFNGAFVHHPLEPKWGLFHFPLDHGTAKRIIEASIDFNVQNIMVEVIDDVYLHKHDAMIVNTFFDPTTSVQVLPERLHTDPTCVLIQPYDRQVESLRQMLEREHAEVVEHRKWGAPWNVIEVVRKGLSKAVGLERICATYDIPAERVIAFGDEDNDLEMLEFAGIGVAMGNAITPLKEVANEITLSNEEEGIAHFLEKHFL
jgi:Cof subfamily protein (haloacid dehalogenase superfamily)